MNSKNKIYSVAGHFASPQGLLFRAGLITFLYLTCEIIGLRQYTTFLCGTFEAGSASRLLFTLIGIVYIFIYLAFTIIVPIMIIASAILLISANYDPEKLQNLLNPKVNRILIGILLFIICIYTLPLWWCSRDAKSWYNGDIELQVSLSNGVNKYLNTPLARENFTTGSSQFDGEWLFGTYMMAGMGYGQTALKHPKLKEKHLGLMDLCIKNIISKRVKAFDNESWSSDPLATLDKDHHHAAYLGYLNLLLSLQRSLKTDSTYAELNDKITAALYRRIKASPIKLIQSYPHEVYPVDNCACFASIALHARATNIDRNEFIKDWLIYFKKRYVDPKTGLIHQAVNEKNGEPVDHPRGSGTVLGLYFLSFADLKFSRELYLAVKKQLAETVFGFGAVSEYPGHIKDGRGDIDSGPLVLGYGISPTGFLIGGSRIHGDYPYYRHLCASAYLFGVPYQKGDKFKFITGGSLGNAIMFAMLTANRGIEK